MNEYRLNLGQPEAQEFLLKQRLRAAFEIQVGNTLKGTPSPLAAFPSTV
jgi:hypothetical protein